MMATFLVFVSNTGNEKARDAREGNVFSLGPLPGSSRTQHNLSKKGSTND
jgi:hypothetical protein